MAGRKLEAKLIFTEAGVGKGTLEPYCHAMKFQDQVEYGLFRMLTGALRFGPNSLASSFLHTIGRQAAQRGWWRADVASRQLAMVYPAWTLEQRSQCLHELFANLASTIQEVFIDDADMVAARVDIPGGWGPLCQALSFGRGVVLASLHLGNFELCGRIIATQCQLLDVVKPQRNLYFEAYLNRKRNQHHIATVPMDRAGPAVLAHLRKGHVVSLLLDQAAGNKGVVVDFLGQAASTWPGAARLSLQTGCPVLPVCLARTPGGRHELEFGPLLEPETLPASQRNVTAYTRLITAELEHFVRRHPEQWFWVHRRWKGVAGPSS